MSGSTASLRVVTAKRKRLTGTRSRIVCGVDGCSEELGHAVRGDELNEPYDVQEFSESMQEDDDSWYQVPDDGPRYHVQAEHPYADILADPNATYLCPPIPWGNGKNRTKAPERRYRIDEHGHVHVVAMKRSRPRRRLPENLVIPAGLEAKRASYPYDDEMADDQIIGKRPEVPLSIYCPACAKRGTPTLNRVT